MFVRVGKHSIHSPEAIRFMEERITTDPYVLDILKEGLKLDFVTPPGPYYEPNNRSCLDNLEVAQQKVAGWLAAGSVKEVSSRPYCCSPLTVSEKTDYLTGTKKKRPCLDLSRHVNQHIVVPKIKLDDLSVSEKLISEGDYQASFDLTNAYFHINIAPAFRKYLGFSLPDSSGVTRYYVFRVMIYGLKPAAYVITRLTKPLLAHLHKRGVKASIFIDDGRITGADKVGTWNQFKYALQLFENAGWNIQHLKTSTEPTQKLYHMGFWCDSASMSYTISDPKLQHIQAMIDLVLQNPKCQLKLLSSIAGKLMSTLKAMGPVIPILLRSSFVFLAEHLEPGSNDYDQNVSVGARVLEDLTFLRASLEDINGYPIFGNKIGFCLNQALVEGDLKSAERELGPTERLWISDSSEIKAAAYNAFDIGNEISIHTFTATQQELSSSAREFMALFLALTRLQDDIGGSGVRTLYWTTDSQVLVVWLTKGTKILFIQQKLIALYKMLHQLRVRIIPIWLPRSNALIRMADECSKFRDTDDWGLSLRSFKIVEKLFRVKFTCDACANGTNKKTEKFYSKVAAPGTSGVNAFMQDWSQEVMYVCPPVNLIIDVYQYIRTVPCSGVLVIPQWERNSYWPVITIDGFHLQPEFQSFIEFFPEIVTGPEAGDSAFHHGSRKKMLAIRFEPNTPSPLTKRCLVGTCGICS